MYVYTSKYFGQHLVANVTTTKPRNETVLNSLSSTTPSQRLNQLLLEDAIRSKRRHSSYF